jgi:hypothetical protein
MEESPWMLLHGSQEGERVCLWERMEVRESSRGGVRRDTRSNVWGVAG